MRLPLLLNSALIFKVTYVGIVSLSPVEIVQDFSSVHVELLQDPPIVLVQNGRSKE